MSRAWTVSEYHRTFRGFRLHVYETGHDDTRIWVWTIRRDSPRHIALGTAKTVRQAKLDAVRAVERLARRKP